MKRLTPSDIFPSHDALARIVESFARARIAVVGDFFLDQYLVIDPALGEPSVETNLTAHQVVATRQSPGAAGTVVNNLASLEAGQLHAVGIIGDDGPGYVLRRELEARGVDSHRLIIASDRFTPTYTKPMFTRAGSETEGERIDIINRTPTPAALEDALLAEVEDVLPHVDAVILLDQVVRPDVGVLTARVRAGINRLAAEHPNIIFYADSRAAIAGYRSVLVKPNQHEALAAVGDHAPEPLTDQRVEAAGQKLFALTQKPVFITRGENGMLLTSASGQSLVPGIHVAGPLDICGAGDSATAGIVLALCAKATLEQAAFIGNLVASKTVVQIGTTGTTTRKELLKSSIA